jgi:16S rRNA (uracil1498-N3)-methyltransferase
VIRVTSGVPLGAGTERVALDDAERHHLRVRRVAVDTPVEVLDGQGGVASGRLASAHGGWYVAVDSIRHAPEPAPLVLLVGAGDRDRMAGLVEKAQELGVTRLVPVLTAAAASVATRMRDRHLDKLERRAVEAMKQSGAPWRVRIEAPIDLAAELAGVDTAHRWVADIAGGAPPRVPGIAGVTVLVGPEGGLTGGELAEASAAGFVPVRLGLHVLRFDTAAVAALALISVDREGP